MTTEARASDLPLAAMGLVEQLAATFVACRLHGADHGSVRRPVAAILGNLTLLLQDCRTDRVALLVTDGGLTFRGRTPIPSTVPASRVLEVLRQWQAAGLGFMAGATEDELATLLHMLVQPPAGVDDLTTLARAAAGTGCRRVGLIPPAGSARRPTQPSVDFTRVFEEVSDALVGIAAGRPLEMPRFASCAGAILSGIDNAAQVEGTVLDLSRREVDDPLGAHHAVRVCALTMSTARRMTRDESQVERIGLAALLHDVGRTLLPIEQLRGHGGSAPDVEELPEHASLGAEVLMGHEGIDPLCVAVAFGHHRLPTGGGLPWTAHEHRTSRLTQLVRIADLFETMTARTDRREPLAPSEAYRALTAVDRGVDLGLLRRFVEANGIHPLGALVQLSSGEVARVVRQTRAPDQPIVRVLAAGRSGAPRGGLVDLSRTRGGSARFIKRDSS